MTDEQISKAIEDHYLLWWTDEMKEKILADVGPEGLARINEIAAVANDSELWVYTPSMSDTYDKVRQLLKQRFPFLSESAILRLANSAAYGWK
jgi:hypothetical protein